VVRIQTTRKLGNGQLLSKCKFVQNIVPPSLSGDRRIKMEQNKPTTNNSFNARYALDKYTSSGESKNAGV